MLHFFFQPRIRLLKNLNIGGHTVGNPIKFVFQPSGELVYAALGITAFPLRKSKVQLQM